MSFFNAFKRLFNLGYDAKTRWEYNKIFGYHYIPLIFHNCGAKLYNLNVLVALKGDAFKFSMAD